ncbi:hypothetical protein GYMLUDRAFT_824649 [Collybiopsis luxurians FD-317 M1]|uniref:Uncharacterized protein n=1 Tax=Collybiopsis luxurians FD-317 M1 TaxID=944289 RepID=A0A0D0CLS2_9AGAR|nr:hypothetical protein GYMLUDRAFT_824649 [Collybiopsis luxurians FD-317 M1]
MKEDFNQTPLASPITDPEDIRMPVIALCMLIHVVSTMLLNRNVLVIRTLFFLAYGSDATFRTPDNIRPLESNFPHLGTGHDTLISWLVA